VENPLQYFPLNSEPREKQVMALEFIQRAYDKGFRDIIISAPTGIGKTGIGAACCFWGEQPMAKDASSGGYYLVTQKMLQDQIQQDFPRFGPAFHNGGVTLKSAVEYDCPRYKNCMTGMRTKPTCNKLETQTCNYIVQRGMFNTRPLSVTNYPYFLTERMFVKKLPKRNVLVCDECHTLEHQLLSFVEFSVTRASRDDWAPHLVPPKCKHVGHFFDWMDKTYLPALDERLEMVQANLEDNPHNVYWQRQLLSFENHKGRAFGAINRAVEEKWIFWQEDNGDCILKPLSAQRDFQEFIKPAGEVRIYMSAYVGPTEVFCHSLGLDETKVAHIKLSSTFPVANRPIFIRPSGSMGSQRIEETKPVMLRECERILDEHANEKGIIHCHSYRLGKAIHAYLLSTKHAHRILFAENSSKRGENLKLHSAGDGPTVVLSPSMTEGYSFDDELARFQIITKMPFPYLGDKQVAAKKDENPDWYTLQTVMTFIQACGRIVRSDDDYGSTYVLDSDFERVYKTHAHFFPKWFTSGFIWPN